MASRRNPPDSVALDTQLTDRRVRGGAAREVLLVGELSHAERAELFQRGAVVTALSSLEGSFEELATRSFDVVVVNPLVDGCGLDFVNAIKEGPSEHEHTVATLYGARGAAAFLRGVRPPATEVLEAARARHRTTPFIVLPGAGDTHYAIIVLPPYASIRQAVAKTPVITAILTVTAAALLGHSGAMA